MSSDMSDIYESEMVRPGSACSQDTLVSEPNILPQYGFGADVAFSALVDNNPFLFRVHTPKTVAPFFERTEPYFVSPKFVDYNSGASTMFPSTKPSYADATLHLDWTTRASSPYVSVSFSFAWAIWEATRRYHQNVKHDVEIAIIDARLIGKAYTAVELLRQGIPKDRHTDHWKWYRFALESQDVLVYGYIPGNAIMASIPLLQLISNLPSYFLIPDSSDAKDTHLNHLAWDYTRKKPSFRQFCQEVTERFLRLPIDRRLRDTSIGSTRLALCFLRPWFHRIVRDDFVGATVALYDMSGIIARWPGQWWVREHPEIKDLIKCAVHMLAAEVREARRIQALADVGRMQEIVGGLEQLAQAYEARAKGRKQISETPSSAVILPSQTSIQESETRAEAERESSTSLVPTRMSTDEAMPSPQAQIATPEELALTTQSSELVPNIDESKTPHGADLTLSLDYVAKAATALLGGFLVGTMFTILIFSSSRRPGHASFT